MKPFCRLCLGGERDLRAQTTRDFLASRFASRFQLCARRRVFDVTFALDFGSSSSERRKETKPEILLDIIETMSKSVVDVAIVKIQLRCRGR